jgi:hypothetical protein
MVWISLGFQHGRCVSGFSMTLQFMVGTCSISAWSNEPISLVLAGWLKSRHLRVTTIT